MKVLVWLVLVALVLGINAQSIVFVLFKVNQKQIAKELCVEREVVNSCCQGSCYLKKSLTKLNQNPTAENTANSKAIYQVLKLSAFILPNFQKTLSFFIDTFSILFPKVWVFGRVSGIETTIWHPPCAA